MMTAEQRERLRQFFGAYFHQDWGVEYGTVDLTLDAAIRAHESEREDLSRLIRAFVDEHPEDSDLDRALWKELACEYLPSADGVSARAWLLGVAAKLAPDGVTPDSV